jgi:ribonuclease HI
MEDSRGEELVTEFDLQGYKGSTGNQMELYACVQAMKELVAGGWLSKADKIRIKTDSMYVVNGHKQAMFVWGKNRWRNREGRPVEHAELWKDLVRLLIRCKGRVSIQWVKGHSKDHYNRKVDKLAKKSAKGLLSRTPLSVTNVRRKLSPLSVQPGCILMRGQTETIRIISDKRLKQKECKYCYEVVDSISPDYPKVDVVYSTHDMRAGHTYRVAFNSNQRYPQVDTVIEEISGGVNTEQGVPSLK